MTDINGKIIRAGMCLEIVYDEDIALGVGQIIERDGELGFIMDNEFTTLRQIDPSVMIGFLVVKE